MFTTPAYRNPRKSSSIPFTASGVYRAQIVAVHDDLSVDIVVPRLTNDFVYYNIPTIGFTQTPMYQVGDFVFVAFPEGRTDDFVVLGPVRISGGYEEPGAGGLDALTLTEEYAFTRSGTVNTGPSFSWPIRRSTTFEQMVATLVTAGSTDTEISVTINDAQIATLTIPSGATSASQLLSEPVVENERLAINVTSAGASAATLFVALRGDLTPAEAIQDPLDEYAFGFSGSVSTGQSHHYPLRRNVGFYGVYATLTSAGSSSTEIDVLLDESVVASIAIPASTTSATFLFSTSAAASSHLSVDVTTAGTGAANLAVFVRGRAE